MSTEREPDRATKSAENSADTPVKKVRGNPAKITAFQFKKDDPETGFQDDRINRSGRPKGTMKDKLRHAINEIAMGRDGKPDEQGRDYGTLLAKRVVAAGVNGDMRAAHIAFYFDLDRPNMIGQGEVVPPNGPTVNVNVNAEAHVETSPKEAGDNLVSRLREIYGLDTGYDRTRTAVAVRIGSNGNGNNGAGASASAAIHS